MRNRLIGVVLALGVGGCYSGVEGSQFGDGSAGAVTQGTGGPQDDGSGDATGEDSGDTTDPVPEGYEPGPVALRLLLRDQYVASVATLLGEQAAAAADPPDDTALNGLTAIGAAQLALGDSQIDRYESSARAVASAAVTSGEHLTHLDCTPASAADETCAATFVESFGRVAFRRSLEPVEVTQYTGVAVAAALQLEGFDDGIEAVIAAMLQSPYFLYQVEQGVDDPQDSGHRLLTDLEMATRLSFFLTGSTPTVDLLDLAENGGLGSKADLRAAAAELVETEGARQALTNFSRELYRLHELDGLPKNPQTFPAFDEPLAAAMHEETVRLIEHIAFEQEGDFREIFDADYTFVNDVLAAHYGIPGEFGPEFVQVELPPDQKRGGILGHAGLLSVLAHVSSTSPTLRGKFIRESILCQTIPPPPPEVVTDLPAGDTTTVRERLEQHMDHPSCEGCHALMDPLGFGLESYDGIGAYRTLDNGQPIDDTSEVDGQPFSGAAQLGAALKANEAAAGCLLRNIYRNATGHVETQSEDAELEAVSEAFEASGFRIKDALVEIAASPAFRVVGDPQ